MLAQISVQNNLSRGKEKELVYRAKDGEYKY